MIFSTVFTGHSKLQTPLKCNFFEQFIFGMIKHSIKSIGPNCELLA